MAGLNGLNIGSLDDLDGTGFGGGQLLAVHGNIVIQTAPSFATSLSVVMAPVAAASKGRMNANAMALAPSALQLPMISWTGLAANTASGIRLWGGRASIAFAIYQTLRNPVIAWSRADSFESWKEEWWNLEMDHTFTIPGFLNPYQIPRDPVSGAPIA